MWSSLISNHIDDVALFLTVMLALYYGTLSIEFDKTVVPTIGGQDNVNFAYPIQISGEHFFPSQITACVNGEPGASNCSLLFDIDLLPESEVSYDCLMVFLAILSVTTLLLHSSGVLNSFYNIYYGNFRNRRRSCSNGTLALTFVAIFWEVFVGLFFAVGMENAIEYLIRHKVASPRPNYYALKLWASIDPVGRLYYLGSSCRSFPSGHAASCGSILGYCALVLIQDASVLSAPSMRLPCRWVVLRVVWLVVWLLLLTTFFVGATRIKDYWHFSSDVIGENLFVYSIYFIDF